MTGYVPAWAAFLTGFLVLLFGGSFGVWVGFGLGWDRGKEDAELQAVQDDARRHAQAVWQIRRPPVEVAHDYSPREVAEIRTALAWAQPQYEVRVPPNVALQLYREHEDQAVALANSGSDEERVAAAMADLDVFMTRLLADHPEEGP
jgi:hypothetical protein